jgi:hypothetical protein
MLNTTRHASLSTPIYLAFYKGPVDAMGFIIRKWTSGPYSHCEIVKDGTGYSSDYADKGVRAKDGNFHDKDRWDLVYIPWANHEAILEHFNKTNGQPYGILSLFTDQLFNRARDIEPHAAFCSEWCAAALGFPNPSMYSPTTLYNMILFLNTFCAGPELPLDDMEQ